MGVLSKIFGRRNEGKKRFRGQGYTEEGALHHAVQRMEAWLKEMDDEQKHVTKNDKQVYYVKKNSILIICYIEFSFIAS